MAKYPHIPDDQIRNCVQELLNEMERKNEVGRKFDSHQFIEIWSRDYPADQSIFENTGPGWKIVVARDNLSPFATRTEGELFRDTGNRRGGAQIWEINETLLKGSTV